MVPVAVLNVSQSMILWFYDFVTKCNRVVDPEKGIREYMKPLLELVLTPGVSTSNYVHKMKVTLSAELNPGTKKEIGHYF